jgi:hypothetical protein
VRDVLKSTIILTVIFIVISLILSLLMDGGIRSRVSDIAFFEGGIMLLIGGLLEALQYIVSLRDLSSLGERRRKASSVQYSFIITGIILIFVSMIAAP